MITHVSVPVTVKITGLSLVRFQGKNSLEVLQIRFMHYGKDYGVGAETQYVDSNPKIVKVGNGFRKSEYTQFVRSFVDEKQQSCQHFTVSEVKNSRQTLCLALHDPEDEGTTVLRNVCNLFASRHDVTYRKAASGREPYSFVFHQMFLCSLFAVSFSDVEFVFV